ncbi:MAG: double-strand break repair protein AddB [Pseudomonadota bacterium]
MTDPQNPHRNVGTIPAGAPFVDRLAEGLIGWAAGDPLTLSSMTVLLPTRRACRALRDAFLRISEGRALLLPELRPIGDVAEDAIDFDSQAALGQPLDLPPALGALTRRTSLARLLLARGDLDLTAGQALHLADALGRLLDESQTERLGFDHLADIVAEEMAVHWQETVRFLEILTQAWPVHLAEIGAIDQAERRNLLIGMQAELWRAKPPKGPVIAAGSTGSIPATADLLAVIAALEKGLVLLPGLDRRLTDDEWQALDETHPQYGMKRLLGHLEVERHDVADWPAERPQASAANRSVLVREIMRPASTADEWRRIEGLDRAALKGLAWAELATEREEAETIALRLRQILEIPGHTAMLVTPDRPLARRVAAALGRWGIEIDDSAGQPLSETPVGAFLRVTAEAAAEQVAPRALLSLLKHPLAAGGMSREAFRDRVRQLELLVLRGPKPAPGLDRLSLLAGRADGELGRWLADLTPVLSPFFDAMSATTAAPEDLLRLLAEVCEALAETDEMAGPLRLWRNEDGEAAAALIAEAMDALASFPAVRPPEFPALLEALLAGAVVRPRYGDHPRLRILGPLEARLQQADLIVLGGLNEGTWPADPGIDPWMSRPMRKQFGLPAPERRIGLAAHDVAQAMAAPNVLLTRARRVDGTPMVASRWWLRLDAVLKAAQLDLPYQQADQKRAALLDDPGSVRPRLPPEPRPPVAARPRKLSVTGFYAWQVDPYALYAEKILGLRQLDPIEASPGAAERGQILHAILAEFLAKIDPTSPDALTQLLKIGRAHFRTLSDYPGLMAFWWPRFERVAVWIVARERDRPTGQRPLALEAAGRLYVDAPAGRFEVTARVDRIDGRAAAGASALTIIDYKTGQPPSTAMVTSGYYPQLQLEALIAEAGGFAGVSGQVERLAFWHLSGGREPGRERAFDEAEVEELKSGADKGLKALIAAFDRPETPYRSHPRGRALRPFGYDHLARVKEWSAGTAGGDG